MAEIVDNWEAVIDIIIAACQRSGRRADAVNLIAVSKTFPATDIRETYDAGQRHFGESKLQEAEPKILALPGSIHWHFIGSVQRNKVRKLLQSFEVIHGISSLRLASYTNEIAKELAICPQVFLQVNIGKEQSKGGFEIAELKSEMEELLRLKNIDVLGLMCIPPASALPEDSRKWFSGLRELRDLLETEFDVKLPSLSMGMSNDYSIAIEEGATHVRVGSAIFGKRAYRVDGELG